MTDVETRYMHEQGKKMKEAQIQADKEYAGNYRTLETVHSRTRQTTHVRARVRTF